MGRHVLFLRWWLIVTLTEEPDRKGGRPGAVYVWARDLNPRASSAASFPRSLIRKGWRGEPRVYRLPYSRPLF